MPRNTRRYDEAAKKLRKNGIKPSQAGMLCAVMNVLGEASRQVGYVPETVWKERKFRRRTQRTTSLQQWSLSQRQTSTCKPSWHS